MRHKNNNKISHPAPKATFGAGFDNFAFYILIFAFSN